MRDYSKELPSHREGYVGVNDLFLEVYEGERKKGNEGKRPPLLFVHGAFTGSWMWSKYIPYFVREGWRCYAMNLRGHYKSRGMDLSRVTFGDYLKDVEDVIAEIGEAPIVIGFSMGGIIGQKLAEKISYAGLILIDSSICREVNQIVPYKDLAKPNLGLIVPAPEREETVSVDESEEDIMFQRKYLSMESTKAFYECGCWIEGVEGVSVDCRRIECPVLTIRAVNNEEDRRRAEAEAGYFGAEYAVFENTTHTGLLVGRRFAEIAERIGRWLNQYDCLHED